MVSWRVPQWAKYLEFSNICCYIGTSFNLQIQEVVDYPNFVLVP